MFSGPALERERDARGRVAPVGDANVEGAGAVRLGVTASPGGLGVVEDFEGRRGEVAVCCREREWVGEPPSQ